MSRKVRGLAALFVTSGVIHFVKPEVFEAIVPKALPNKRELVYVSGAIELACAAMLVNPRTSRLGGLLSAGLLVGIFPANVQMAASAVQSPKAPGWYKAATVARLPLQYPLIRTALGAGKS